MCVLQTHQTDPLDVAVSTSEFPSLSPLSEYMIGISSRHGLHDIRGRHETHESKRHDEQGTKDQPRLGEGQRESQGSHSYHQVEDVGERKLCRDDTQET